MNKKITGLAFISFLFSIAGIVISTMTIREDVTSTAHTIFEYFPFKYGVTPSSTWEGALILGLFTTVLQVVAASVAFNKNFGIDMRGVAAVALILGLGFDNWTDVVFRSGNLTGDLTVAIVTTVAFYTLGSEIMQSLSWLVLLATWRPAISDIMWGLARFSAGISSIGREWKRFQSAAGNKENSERNRGDQTEKPHGKPIYRPNQSFSGKNHFQNYSNQPKKEESAKLLKGFLGKLREDQKSEKKYDA